MTEKKTLRLPALQIKQGSKEIYSFSIDGTKLSDFTTISRISRDEDANLQGYQRTESRKHINEIQRYLESENPMVPNSLVVAFDERVEFDPRDGEVIHEHTQYGWLKVPVDPDEEDHNKPGWIVDGQQRLAALRQADIDTFPMSVTAFIASSVKEQREQFILVNSTKSVKRSIIYELLPGTETELPSKFQKKKFAAEILEQLNHREECPLEDDVNPMCGVIKTPTTTGGRIKDNSVLQMLNNSLKDGVLYHYRDPETGRGDIEKMLKILVPYWRAVAEVFPTAWNLKPRKSRLTHGAGVKSMGFLMDTISEIYRFEEEVEFPGSEEYKKHLERIKPYCNWTSGYWEFGDDERRKWDDIQNLQKDIQPLTNYLLNVHREATQDLY